MKKLLSILIVCAVAVSAAAIPARREALIRTMPDGTEKTVYLHGNAFFHYLTDAEGVWLDEETLTPLSAEERTLRETEGHSRLQMRRARQQEQAGTEPNIAPRGLLIMVNFTDKAFVTSYDTIHEMLNGDHFRRDYSYSYRYGIVTRYDTIHARGSARQYFQDQSYGQYNPVFDVAGPYTLSNNYAYYGRNNDANVGYMIKEACEMADADGADFTLYDNDNDGMVDFVYVLYAGYGEADGGDVNTIWPHNSDLTYYGIRCNCFVDGKQVGNYACSNELNYQNNMYNGIGTFCHEFSHVLGLPDLYETNQSPKGLHTLLDWDILDYGPYNNDGNTPPCYSAYERFYMGWLTPRVLTEPESVWLNPLQYKNGEALLMCDGDAHNLVGYDPEPKTFYLIESRVKNGWDQFLPGEGMLITKIKYNSRNWALNEVNNSSTNMGVDLMEARTNVSSYAKASDAFPSGAKQWYGFEDHEIEQIAIEAGGAVSFSYRFAAKSGVETPVASQTAHKILRDGQILIVRGDKTYDVTGKVTSDK